MMYGYILRFFRNWKLPSSYPKIKNPGNNIVIKAGKSLRKIKRKEPPTEIVLHESCMRSRKDTVKVLKRRKLGVHYMVDRAGGITEHVDPKKYYTVHAGGDHNKNSIAIEVLNRYYGHDAIDEELVIDAVWAHKGKYIVPTREQLESVWQLIKYLDVEFDVDLIKFPCATILNFRWKRSGDHLKPGIKAHHRWHHADGLFIEAYCFLRSKDIEKEKAYMRTYEAAKSGKRETYL